MISQNSLKAFISKSANTKLHSAFPKRRNNIVVSPSKIPKSNFPAPVFGVVVGSDGIKIIPKNKTPEINSYTTDANHPVVTRGKTSAKSNTMEKAPNGNCHDIVPRTSKYRAHAHITIMQVVPIGPGKLPNRASVKVIFGAPPICKI